MAKYTWVPIFEEIANKLLEYENNQLELIEILKQAGITIPSDRDKETHSIDLKVIDPFTFYCQITKIGTIEKQLNIINKIKNKWKLESEMPEDLSGVPSVFPQNSWLFAFKYERENSDIPTLWKLFKEILHNELTAATFHDVLKQKQVGLPMLTQGMFYVRPRRYLPLNKQIRLFFNRRKIDIPEGKEATLSDYLNILEKAKEILPNKEMYEISHEAWRENQGMPTDNAAILATESKNKMYCFNLILYGPPGTGKTYQTKSLSIEIVKERD